MPRFVDYLLSLRAERPSFVSTTSMGLAALLLSVGMSVHAAPQDTDTALQTPVTVPTEATPVSSLAARLSDVPVLGAGLGHLNNGLGQIRQSMSQTTSDLVLNAMGFLGVPYRRGGSSAETGFDCSGFVRSVYENTLGMVLPRRAAEQAQSTAKINSDELRPGDLVFFNTMRRAFSHVGIYVGDGKFIHSPRAGGKVRVEDMRESYWAKRFNGARRVETAPGTPPVDTRLIMPGTN